METTQTLAHVGYLFSIMLFAFGIKQLTKIKTSRSGNQLAALAMLVAVACQLLELGTIDWTYMLIGALAGGVVGGVLALSVEMTAMPQLVAVFNGFGGLASTAVALSLVVAALYGYSSLIGDANLMTLSFQGSSGLATAVSLILSVVIGSITFTGSIMAYLKLSDVFGRWFGNPIMLPARHLLNLLVAAAIIWYSYQWVAGPLTADNAMTYAYLVTGLTMLLGILLVIPIGGADMPVVISLLNSYSGLAAAATGFALGSNVLIVSGTLVGASGIILTTIMCKGMNRSLLNVMVGGFGGDAAAGAKADNTYTNVKSADAEEAILDFDGISSVVIVPGYGLAVAQGQNAVREFADQLKGKGISVKYAIHPVAGRMPGHMNVLLAESNVPYDELYEMDSINNDFQQTDVAIVVGANDVVNPDAKDDPASPLYGMPVLNVEQARMVFVIKRSLSPGFAGVKNSLFERDNTRMIYGDAKKVLEEMTTHFNEN